MNDKDVKKVLEKNPALRRRSGLKMLDKGTKIGIASFKEEWE